MEMASATSLEDAIARMDSLVRKLSWRLRKENEDAGRSPLQPLDPADGSARYKAICIELYEPFAVASELMQGLLGRSPVDRRSELKDKFGKDKECEKLARVRSMLTTLLQALGKRDVTSEGVDPRLRRCSESCDSIEAVLKELGLQERLRRAREAQSREVQRIFEHCSEQQKGFQRLTSPDLRETKARRWELLQRLDEADEDVNSSSKELHELFSLYGCGNEVLEGQNDGSSYNVAVQDMVEYIQWEWNQRESRLTQRLKKEQVLGPLTSERAREWVLKAIDPDGDGCITKEEAFKGFKIVVDEVDPPQERRKAVAER
jgi:hypothetical protein